MKVELTDYILALYAREELSQDLINRISNFSEYEFGAFILAITEKSFDLIPSLRLDMTATEIVNLFIKNLKSIDFYNRIDLNYYEKRYSAFFIDQEKNREALLPAYEDLFLNHNTELLDIRILTGLLELYLGDLENITPQRVTNMKKLREIIVQKEVR